MDDQTWKFQTLMQGNLRIKKIIILLYFFKTFPINLTDLVLSFCFITKVLEQLPPNEKNYPYPLR